MQCISVDSPDSTYITKDYIVTHNTFLLSVYCLLRALLIPNRKIVVVGSAFRQSRYLHDYMENIWKNAPILRDLCDDNSGPRRDVDMCKMTLNNSTVVALPIGDGCVNPYTLMTYEKSFGCMLDKNTKVWGNGKYRDIDYYHDNGVKPTKIVTTRCGYSYEGTHNHAMKVLRNSEIQWVRSDQMVVGDRILIDRSGRWHSGDFKCTQDEAYTLGAMIGDGCWTNKYQLRFATKDLEIIDRVNSVFDNSFSRQKDDIHWNMYGINKVAAWVNFWQLNSQCYTNDKTLPNTILSAPQDKMTACLQGLFDTDGHVFVSRSKGGTTISVNFTNTSKRLVEQIQYILLHYGIVSTVKNRNRNQKWNTVYELGIYGKNVKLFAEKIGFYLPRKRDTLLAAISERKQWNSFNDDIPVNSDVVEQSIDRNKAVPHKLCKSKILSKKSFQQQFLQEVLIYCNNPGWASLVDSNIYYDEIVSIKDSECHTHDIHVPEDNEYCANGFFSHNSKIRGQRANDIVADEFACLRSNSLVQTDLGLISIRDYLDGSAYSLMNENGVFEYPDTIFRTPPCDVYRITTTYGYKIECSEIHQVLTNNGWKKTLDLTNKDYIKLGHNDYFPSNYIDGLDNQMAWLLGILISEGSVANRNNFSIKNTDRKLIEKIKTLPYQWTESYKEEHVNKRGWKCKESWELKCSDTSIRSKMKDFGLDYDIAINKKIPKSILMSPRDVVISFLSGMYEGDGSAFISSPKNRSKELQVVLYSSSKVLLETTQTLLLKFGIMSSINCRKSKISKNSAYRLVTRGGNAIKLYNLLDVIKWDIEMPEMTIKDVRKPRIKKNGLRYTVSTSFCNKNKHLGTFDSVEECETAFYSFWSSNTEYIKIESVEKLPEKEVLYDFHMPETHSFIANGFVQHNSMNLDIFENVIAGFAAVSASPAENVKRMAKEKLAKELGISIENIQGLESQSKTIGNQIILSGTAYYDFNHFASYWRRWKTIINTKGDLHRIKMDVFNGEEPPASFNWKDYSIIRIPVDLVPKGFMDEGQIARSKATIHNGIYLMEFSACGVYETPVITKEGIKSLGEIKYGDYVLTHKGRFRKVVKTTCRPYHGQVSQFSSYGYYEPLTFTVDHPFWKEGEEFEGAGTIDILSLSKISELTNKQFINSTDLSGDYIDIGDSIYPIPSQSKTTNEQRKNIIERYKSGESARSIALNFGLTASGVYQLVYNKRKPKNSIPKIIPLNEDFGKIIGYYASEGSISSGGKTCGFALDGHVNKDLQYYVDDLSQSIFKSLNIKPKIYSKADSVISLNVNSRILADILKNICPGNCYNKLIDHDTLFSNENFMKGFIIGVWNGDGHIRKNFATIQLANKNLINQIKMVLSYFGINCSFIKPNRPKTSIIKGKVVSQADIWRLNISGSDFINFMKVFYNK